MFILSDSFNSKDKLFHSRIVFGKKDLENISFLMKGIRSELFRRRLTVSVLCGIRLQMFLKYGGVNDFIIL